ncbi:hypothetical protein [Thiobacter aerophilum]|uniref:Uncharacterized protein n=1 Tax=Thiobacter aerophilum TaxID=3121275 RepID=A0ABV0EG99_9BURK
MESEKTIDLASSEDAAPSASRANPSRSGLKGHILTWMLSVLSACIIGAAWVYTHPQPGRLAMVDMAAILKEEIAKMDREIKPDMTDAKKQEIAARLSKLAEKMKWASDQVAKECGCTIISAGAVLSNGSKDVQDLTWRVKQLVSQ